MVFRDRAKKIGLPAFLIIAAVILYALQYSAAEGDKPSQEKSSPINEYKGKKLSSIADFRENSIRGPQHIDRGTYRLKISGLVRTPKSYGYDDIVNDTYRHFEKVVRLDCVEGWSVTLLWEGILVRDLLKESQPLPEAKTVIFYAYDGYSTSFPVDYILNNDIIMAYKMNGVSIPPERGFPFQLVAEKKWGYKWIKWITEIELSDNVGYKGYWERRGYSNSGDLDKGFFQ